MKEEFGKVLYPLLWYQHIHPPSHTKALNLSYETEDEYADTIIEDIGLCQTLLSMNCSITPAVFTYPYGSISKESIPVLRSMGFSAAYSCYERPNYITRDPQCLFTLDRYNRSGRFTTEEYMAKLLKE